MPLDDIRIVLVAPKHPGNIGAVARAMKTMAMHELVLVRPADFPAIEAERRALGAVDILIGAKVVDTLEEAIGDCQLAIAATARSRAHPHPVLDARASGRKLFEEARAGAAVAAVFGPERTGLSNSDIDLCNFELRIPTSADFRSLNLGSAVQILCYEVLMASLEAGDSPMDEPGDYPTQNEMEYFFTRLEAVLDARGFLAGDRREAAMSKLRRLLGRSRPQAGELKLLHSLVKLMRSGDSH